MTFYICGKKTIQGKMDYGELLIFQDYSQDFSSSLQSVRELSKSVKDGIKSWVKFLQVYDIEQKVISLKNIILYNKDKIRNEDKKGFKIQFKNVSFSYPAKKSSPVIKNLNLKVEEGKTVAIVGSSGSGKTTLTNLLLRFYDVDEGEILINDINIKDVDLTNLRESIGIVSQEPILTSGTIKENILYGVSKFDKETFEETCKLANVSSFATNKEMFPKEYDTIVGERGIKVSGGQKQRIAIARALIKDARLLIFDEATSALDSENEAIVQEAINNVMNKKKNYYYNYCT
jgi:ABC-type multidrug transport system fused ATPase/permease subunit